MNEALEQTFERLYRTICERKGMDVTQSYVAGLFAKGRSRIAQKVGEEAVETAIAAAENNAKAVTEESCDLLFHLIILWAELGIKPQDIIAEIQRREGISGLDEKAARKLK